MNKWTEKPKSLKMFILFLMLITTVLCQGRVITVDDNGFSNFDNIQAAIDDSKDGDTVIVQPGTYMGYVYFRGKNITLTSSDPTNPNVVAATNIGSDIFPSLIVFNGIEDSNCTLSGFNVNGIIRGVDFGSGTPIYNHTHANISYCLFERNRGGTSISQVDGEIRNCIIACNIYQTMLCVVYPIISNCNGTIKNCTIANNYYSYGGVIDIGENGKTTIENCIIYGNSPCNQNFATFGTGAILNILYSNVPGGFSFNGIGFFGEGSAYWGTGNIDADPCFLKEGYWDNNGTFNICEDDIWVSGNYNIKPNSHCIDAGNPNYIAEVNETDLDGRPRLIGERIDMGAYEFNQRPIANTGSDQTVYAYIDGIADVNLDGSDSNDADGDAITYKWTCAIDSDTYEANVVNPIIELPVGVHTIELVVNDGYEDSLPDYVDVNVVEPVKAGLEILPQTINIRSQGRWIWVYMVLPKGYDKKDIDVSEPLVMEPLGVESKWMNVFTMFRRYVCITAAFDRDEVCDNIKTGRQEISVVGQFKTGQYFYGSDVIKVIGKKK